MSIAGVLVVDKPKGPTSHDVVARMRRALRTREVGHAGTLDPMATGVLVVAIGEATKLVPYLTAADKTYEATVALGVTTETLDAEGATRTCAPVAEALLDAIAHREFRAVEAALDVERGRSSQEPPVFSAIHAGGERAHERARRGEVVTLAARPVEVRAIALLDAGLAPSPWLALRLTVAKGYYVRALARDLGAALGTVAHLTALRRTHSGVFSVADAIALDVDGGALAGHVIPMAQAVTLVLPRLALTERGVVFARHGRPIAPGDHDRPDFRGTCSMFGEGDALVAIGEVRDDGYAHVLRGVRASEDATR